MSFQEVKNIEGEVARLDKLFAREKDWDARKLLAEEIMGHCRRLADLEKRAFVSAKVHSEEWLERLEQERELCMLRPLEERVAAIAKVPFSAETYEARKQSIESLLVSIIEQQRIARDTAPYRLLLERLWQISVSEDENYRFVPESWPASAATAAAVAETRSSKFETRRKLKDEVSSRKIPRAGHRVC